jgi:uncharacterized protein YqgV (UPF0045/DUF77 family)
MDNIIQPNETFDFSKLSLAHPSGIQGGAYFTKIEYNNKPLYIQTNKCQTRQGFIKTGKKYYCDLMFDKNAESLINWFENLEDKCKKLIYEKRDTWFQNNLEETDIETAFNAIIRVYKSGKYYLVRTHIKNTHTNLPAVKIYNEQEVSLTIDDVTSETNIISILEVQGIKFTSRNFQIDIELKQVMVLDNEPLFDNCLINKNKNKNIHTNSIVVENNDITNLEVDTLLPNTEFLDNLEDIPESDSNNNSEELIAAIEIDNPKDDNISLELEIEDLTETIEENINELREFDNNDLNLENNLETMQLKKPNQVYFELYKEARKKAKQAKKNAILAYLEAKNIKKTYLIENLDDSDSDFDAEIDEVSESELDNL